MQQYEVAEMVIDISSENSYLLKRLETFTSKKTSASDLNISTQNSKSIVPPPGRVLMNDTVTWMRKSGENGGYAGYKCFEGSDEIMALFDADDSWQRATVTSLENYIPGVEDKTPAEIFSFHIVGLLFRNRILYHQGIIIHASSIEWNGKGIIFSAPSGTGKSTHVRLWEQYVEGVQVLNDDTPAVRIINGKPFVYGTPWSGSSDKFINKKTPLEAIVVLEQNAENRISRLSAAEAVERLIPRCFLPYFDGRLMNEAIRIFEKIIESTPVYLLKCRPDREAVEKVLQCLR